MTGGPSATPRGPSLIPHTHRFGITAKWFPGERVPPDQQDRQAAHTAAATVPAPSVFSGVGVFTAWDASAAIGLKADWVALQLDPEGGDHDLVELRRHFTRVFGWQARPDSDGVLEAQTRLDGYIGQAENEEELRACLSLPKFGMPRALVANCGDWWNDYVSAVTDQGWDLLLEAYEGTNPGVLERLTAKNYPGYVGPVYQCTDEGTRVSLAEYRRRMPAANWSVYLAEELSPGDRRLMGDVNA